MTYMPVLGQEHPKLQTKLPDGRTWGDVLREITGGYTVEVDIAMNECLVGPTIIYGPEWIPEAFSQPRITPRQMITHSNAGPKYTRWQALWIYIKRIDIKGEMHFQNDAGTGLMAHLMPLNRRADCNYRANLFFKNGKGPYGAISVENSDQGAETLDQTPFTLPQLANMIALGVCLGVVYDVSCQAPPYWDSSGIGHHILFPTDWTPYKGKTCPGAARIRQMDWLRNEIAKKLAVFMQEVSHAWKCPGTS